ncbi:very short patch repair endonuclease [Bradyrhizobium sp. S69]|uniref:very short patch repair endonuclease n=1 Tax=Bradyrhizobium sp. S69 TaxID=1641856 RepID=UPI001FEDD37D|nr:very short patch repair endonuclease [Bradyrhizobium sp. S69]
MHGKALPGKPDLVFAGRRKVIFVTTASGTVTIANAARACRRPMPPKSQLRFPATSSVMRSISARAGAC